MNTPFRKPRCGRGLPKATVFRALRSKLGGWPLPAAGGQLRRCTGARPNPFLAVGSRNYFSKSPGRTPIVEARPFQVLSKGHRRPSLESGERPGAEKRLTASCRRHLLEFRLGARVFELLLAGFAVGLGHGFLDRLRRAVD